MPFFYTIVGGEISVPSNPSPAIVCNEWMDMIQSGLLSIGEPCSPYTVTKYVSKGGLITKETFEVSGRKISMHELRQRLLNKQEEFMRLHTDHDLAQMGSDELLAILRASNYPLKEREGAFSRDDMQKIIANQQRQRSLAVWHDHAAILNNGLIMITVHVLYDKAVFLTNEEYYSKSGKRVNVQCHVEQPEMYMLVLGSSSVEDQAAVIPDRVECLSELSTPISTTNG